MSHIKKKLERDYLFGVIKYQHRHGIYLMPIGYWILNTLESDPTYNPDEWEFIFRGNILNVTDDNILDFIRAVAVDKIDLDIDLPELRTLPKELIRRFYFFIDLDKKLFISSFADREIENYLPDNRWTGKFDNPMNYLPNYIKSIFAS